MSPYLGIILGSMMLDELVSTSSSSSSSEQRVALSAERTCLFEKGHLNIVLFPYTCGLGSVGQTLFFSLSTESGARIQFRACKSLRRDNVAERKAVIRESVSPRPS